MPPKTKITKEMILDTAFELTRRFGHEALNARKIAEGLNCSTQPILYQFKTMDEIRSEVYRIADAFHSEWLMKGAEQAEDPFLGLGLAYIRFGHEEANLFRFLFQSNRFGGMDLNMMVDDPELNPILASAEAFFGCGPEEAKEKFMTLFIAAHGYASLLANNTLDYSEEQAVRIFMSIYEGLKGKSDEKTL